jgi:hypothetical protein
MHERIILLASLMALATGCSLGEVTHGEKGNATFSYTMCLSDCGLDESMMHGTREGITVHAQTIPALTITSSAPDVVTVQNATPTRQCCSSTFGTESCHDMTTDTCAANEQISLVVDVVASAAGSAELVLTRGDGTVFDQVALSVAEPASIEIDGVKDNKLEISRGANLMAGWKARDAQGNELMATSGVQLSTSDASVVDFQSTMFSSHTSTVDAEQIMTTIDPNNAGDAIITAKAQAASSTTLVHVN